MWGDTIKKTTLLPLVVLAVSLFAIWGKDLRDQRPAPQDNSIDALVTNDSNSAGDKVARGIQLPAVYNQPSRSAAEANWAVPSRVNAQPASNSSAQPSRTTTSEEANRQDDQTLSLPLGAPLVAAATVPEIRSTEGEDLVSALARRLEIDAIESHQSQPTERVSSDPIAMDAQSIAELHSSIMTRPQTSAVALSQDFVTKFLDQIATSQGLVRKGALFSAEREASQALLSLARALDSIGPDHDHERACRIGLQALQDATELHDATDASEDTDRLKLIAQRHATFRAMMPEQASFDKQSALEAYYSLALPLLAYGVGNQPVAAEALVTLGKLHAIAPTAGVDGLGPFQSTMSVPKSVVFHQVALLVHPGHAVAANELAVQVGRLGQWDIARDLLLTSVRTRPSPEAWRNLAEAHQRLGELRFAQLAMQEAQLMQSGNLTPTGLVAQAPVQRPVTMPQGTASEAPRSAQGQTNGVPFFAGVR